MKGMPTLLQHDLIGLNAKVARSSNSDYVNITGRVLEETRNTITILHRNKKKIVVKNTTVFHFTLSDGTIVEVDGKVIVGRPEDRIKRHIKRRW
jgi:ribonuclease P protein subunit POP4